MTDTGKRAETKQLSRGPDLEISLGSAGGKVRSAIANFGDLARFSAQVIRSFPDLRNFMPEVLRQAAILIVSSGLIIWGMQFIIGYQCGLEAKYGPDDPHALPGPAFDELGVTAPSPQGGGK